jgi:hypothetical protein
MSFCVPFLVTAQDAVGKAYLHVAALLVLRLRAARWLLPGAWA